MEFRKMIAEVYQHLQWQLGEVLSEEKSCARICRLIYVLFNNNVEAGVIQYLLQATTSWTGLDQLPSLQVSILHRSLPTTAAKEDVRIRNCMKLHWSTDVGVLMAALLRVSPNVGLGACVTANTCTPSLPPGSSTPRGGGSFVQLLEDIRAKWTLGDLDNCGLAGFMQEQQTMCLRAGSAKLAEPLANYLDCLQLLYDLIYLQKEVFSKFVEISHAFGDYGCCRVQPLLHPFLNVIGKKLKTLADKLQQLNTDFEEYVVRARNLGIKVAKPLPSEKMSRNADEAFHHMVKGEGVCPSHFSNLQQQIRVLEDRSSQDRLPELKKAMKGLLNDLLAIFNSQDYRHCAGNDFVPPPNAGLLEAETLQCEVLQNALEGVGLDEAIYVDDLVAEQDVSPFLAPPVRQTSRIPRNDLGNIVTRSLLPDGPVTARGCCLSQADVHVRVASCVEHPLGPLMRSVI